MTCHDIKLLLQDRFDKGEALEAGFEHHLASCAACRAYAARLEALNDAILDAPLETPAAALADRIRSRIAVEERRELPPSWTAAVAGVCAVASAAAGWFWPMSWNLRDWSAAALDWLPNWDWRGGVGEMIGAAESAAAALKIEVSWNDLTGRLAGLANIPPIVLWTALGACLFALIAFNGIEAVLLHTTAPAKK